MKRRMLAVATAVVLLAASVALALLGRAVLAAPASAQRAAPDWPQRARVGTRDKSAAARAAAYLLDTRRTDTFDEIVAIYRNAISLPAAAGDPRGPIRISRLIPSLSSPGERAQALVMAGTLLAYSAGSGFGVVLPGNLQAATATVLGQAREDFRTAVQSDPTNEAAKYDLELLLRQQSAQKPKPKSGKRKKKAPTTQDTRKKTAPSTGQEHHAGIYATGTGY